MLRTTRQRRWPAAAGGAFSDRVDYLRPATAYTFRLCGGDEQQPPACANARTFTTGTPAGDLVKGSLEFQRNGLAVDATSGSAGQSPRGSVTLFGGGQRTYSGFVTCVAVTSDRAAVGAVGQADEDPEPESVLLSLQVRAPGDQGDLFDVDLFPQITPPDCVTASFANLSRAIGGDLAVYYAP